MQVNLKNVRIAFPHLFVAQKPATGQGEPKFNANFLLEKADPQTKVIRDAMMTVATELWGANAKNIVEALAPDKKCLRDGNKNLDKDGNVRDGYEDMAVVIASSKTRPTVVDRARNPLAESDGKPYGGCYVNCLLDVYAQDKPGIGKGIFCQLRGVQFYADGERLGGGSAPANPDEFDSYDDEPGAPAAVGAKPVDDDLGF